MVECYEDTLFYTESYGFIIIELLIIALTFVAMMVLSDKFLMEYVLRSIKKYSLSNAAGGCLIAIGSIIPEFMINLISCVMITKKHSLLGLSTIIGSGCFDFTIVVGIASWVIHSKWKKA